MAGTAAHPTQSHFSRELKNLLMMLGSKSPPPPPPPLPKKLVLTARPPAGIKEREQACRCDGAPALAVALHAKQTGGRLQVGTFHKSAGKKT